MCSLCLPDPAKAEVAVETVKTIAIQKIVSFIKYIIVGVDVLSVKFL